MKTIIERWRHEYATSGTDSSILRTCSIATPIARRPVLDCSPPAWDNHLDGSKPISTLIAFTSGPAADKCSPDEETFLIRALGAVRISPQEACYPGPHNHLLNEVPTCLATVS